VNSEPVSWLPGVLPPMPAPAGSIQVPVHWPLGSAIPSGVGRVSIFVILYVVSVRFAALSTMLGCNSVRQKMSLPAKKARFTPALRAAVTASYCAWFQYSSCPDDM